MIIASPWTRGGNVCSQVFVHTSPRQFLETFLDRKFGKTVREENISPWRRTVCGDLTAAFSRYEAPKAERLPFLPRDEFIEGIYSAKFKDIPSTFRKLSSDEIGKLKANPAYSGLLPRQEPGTNPSRAIPYALSTNCPLSSKERRVGKEWVRK